MLEAPGLHVFSGFYYYYHYSTNNEYIPKALNPPYYHYSTNNKYIPKALNSPYYHYSTNNEYIPKALNPPMCDLHVAQSVVHVQLKPSKERNQRRQKKPTTSRKSRGWADEGARSTTTNDTFHNYVTLSLSPPSLSHSTSPPITHSSSLSLSLTDQQYRQQKSTKSLSGDQGSSEKAEGKKV